MNNNNRGNNNRRRGRGNRQGGNGGQQLNRIDSRARGNAPQLLEKYRKLAQDAHLNGDRVQAEYYLQFADHYFRVIADQRQRQEEQRSRPQGERWQDDNADGDDAGDFGGSSDFPSFDQPSYNRAPREDRQPREERQRPERQERSERNDRTDRYGEGDRGDEAVQDVSEDSGDADAFEPGDNPFVRETRSRSGLRPRRERAPRQDSAAAGEPSGLDPASLPPAISAIADSDDQPKPRKRAVRRKPAAGGDAGEAVEAVN